jgi:hypothetical protein
MKTWLRTSVLLTVMAMASGSARLTGAKDLSTHRAKLVPTALTYTFTVSMLDGTQYTATALTINHCIFCQAPNDWKLIMTVSGASQTHRADSVVSVQWTH